MGLGFLGPLFMLGGGGGERGQMSEVMREGHQEVSSHPFRQLATVGWTKFLLLVRLHWPKLEKRFGHGCICGRGAQEKKTNKLKDHMGQLLLKAYQVVINTSKPRLPGSIIEGDSC